MDNTANILIALSSGFIGVVAGIFFTAVGSSFKRQETEIRNSLILSEHLFSNLLIISKVHEEVLACVKKFTPQSFGQKVDFQTLENLSVYDSSKTVDLDIDKDTLLTRFFLPTISIVEKMNRSSKLVFHHIYDFQNKLNLTKTHITVVLNQRQFEELLHELFEMWTYIDNFLRFSNMLISGFDKSLTQTGRYFSFVKATQFEAIQLIKTQLILTKTILTEQKKLSLDAESVFKQHQQYKQYFQLS